MKNKNYPDCIFILNSRSIKESLTLYIYAIIVLEKVSGNETNFTLRLRISEDQSHVANRDYSSEHGDFLQIDLRIHVCSEYNKEKQICGYLILA